MIVGVAGHIDHGKSALLGALTGARTDRLPEERARGMTIDIGFAYLPADDDPQTALEPIGFVDLPGHHRFVRNMLAGVGGSDFVLLVVAADDGPMPQTIEHLTIIDLLGIRSGAVVLTKTDRVSPERRAAVARELAELLDGTSLEGAPVFVASGTTGEGIERLRDHLRQAARGARPRARGGRFRMAIDRCFTLPGTGLVVTGSAVSGELAVGDTVAILESGRAARVRSIHAQHRPVARCGAGQRCAVGLKGIGLDLDQVARGEWLVAEGTPAAQSRIDARLRVSRFESRALTHWTAVHVHLGTDATTGRVALLEGEPIGPGRSGLVQLVLDRPVGAVHGDRFIVRDQSASRTLAGGRVLDIFPPLRGRARPERLRALRAHELADPVDALRALLDCSASGIDLDAFESVRNLTPQQMADALAQLPMVAVRAGAARIAFGPQRWRELEQAACAALAEFHRTQPSRFGPPARQLFDATSIRLPRELVVLVVAELARRGVVVGTGLGVRLPDHQPRLAAQDQAIWAPVADLLARNAARPPSVHEIAEALGLEMAVLEPVLERATRCGLAVRVAPNRLFLPHTVLQLAERLRELSAARDGGVVTAAEFRNASTLGRGLGIELLEYFDHVGLTRRIGAGRVLNAGATLAFLPASGGST